MSKVSTLDDDEEAEARAHEERQLPWAPRFLSAVDGVSGCLQPKHPEFCRIRSHSQPGRAYHHKHNRLPQNCESRPPPSPQKPVEGEDQYVYLALIREKVERQYAEQAKIAAAEHKDISPPAAGSDSSPPWRRRPVVPLTSRDSALSRVGANCIASVIASQTNGVTADYLEAQHLGRLYDEWRASLGDEELPVRSRAAPAAAQRPKALPSPREAAVKERRLRQDPVYARTEKLFAVITDTRVRCQRFTDKGMSDVLTAPLPSHIEAFPALEVFKLYQGPWRLNI